MHTNHQVYTATQETTGRLSAGYHRILKICADEHDRRAFDLTAPSRTWACTTFKQYHIQRIAIDFWRGSAAMQQARTHINTIRARAAELAAAMQPHPAHLAHPVPPPMPTNEALLRF